MTTSTITTIDVEDAQTQLVELLAIAMNGGEVVISKDNVPIARLIPLEPQQPGLRTADLHRGAMQAHADFNDPLPEAFWMEGQ